MSITVDVSQLKAWSDNLEKIVASGQQKKLLEDCAKELAAHLVERMRYRAPIKTGRLENSIVAGTSTIQKGKNSETLYKYDLGKVTCKDDIVTISVGTSGIGYASYVEHGHRIMKDGKQVGFVPGRHFMDISVQEIQEIAPEVLEDKILDFLKGIV